MAVRDSATDNAFRAYATQRRFSDSTVDRWLHLAPAEGAVLLALAHDLRLGENQLRDLWDWAEEIAERDGTSIAQVLAADPIASARVCAAGRHDKLKLIKTALKRLRFPQLAATEERLATLVRNLPLPRTVRVILPEHLEGDDLRVEIVARDATTLRDAAVRLLALAQTGAFDTLFDAFGEAP